MQSYPLTVMSKDSEADIDQGELACSPGTELPHVYIQVTFLRQKHYWACTSDSINPSHLSYREEVNMIGTHEHTLLLLYVNNLGHVRMHAGIALMHPESCSGWRSALSSPYSI